MNSDAARPIFGIIFALTISGFWVLSKAELREKEQLQAMVIELQAELDKPDPASCACLNEVKIQKMCAAGVAGAIDQAVQSGQAEELLEILTKRSGR
jgi:hypothetical protein